MSEMEQNPRKPFDVSIDYAIQVSRVYLYLLKSRDIKLEGLRYLEIGPGADLAPQLVLASCGVDVTVADQYLAAWDPDYHPRFYSEFLNRWSGASSAVRAVVTGGGGYAGLISLVAEPVEAMRSLPSNYFGFVQSNAVLEHVRDIGRAVAELARVTATGGIHAHQIDLRDHRDFDNPLAHLLLNPADYRRLRLEDKGNHGNILRLPEFLDIFVKYFWIWDIQKNPPFALKYVRKIKSQLPPDSPYRMWPEQMLRTIGARVWLTRRAPLPRWKF